MIIPCKDCTDRIMGCHSTCQKYKQWQQWYKACKEREAQQQTPPINGYSFSFYAGKRQDYRR